MAGQFSWESKSVPAINTAHRCISSRIPCDGTKERLSTLSEYESRSMQGQLPLLWDRADDFNIYDKAGNKWIDFTSAIFVANVGHSNPSVTKAIREVCEKGLITTYAYANDYRIDYIKKLVSWAGNGFEKAFLLSAGTEATEAALKLMRLHSIKQGKSRHIVICLENNWHGRTMGAQGMSSNKDQGRWISSKDADILHLPFPYPWDLKEKDPKQFWKDSLRELGQYGVDPARDVAGFMLETFQGWGALFYPKEYVAGIREFCDENNVLLCFDEMQSGFARTGKKFGFEHYAVKADLIACGKGMGGGVPVSGVLGSRRVMDLPEVGNMSSTHSANPLVCNAGLAVLEEIESKGLVEKAAEKGSYLHKRLQDIKEKYQDHIAYVFGKGLIASLIFDARDGKLEAAAKATAVSRLCLDKGLLVVHTGTISIKIGPPLTISIDALEEGIQVLESCIKEVIERT